MFYGCLHRFWVLKRFSTRRDLCLSCAKWMLEQNPVLHRFYIHFYPSILILPAITRDKINNSSQKIKFFYIKKKYIYLFYITKLNTNNRKNIFLNIFKPNKVFFCNYIEYLYLIFILIILAVQKRQPWNISF